MKNRLDKIADKKKRLPGMLKAATNVLIERPGIETFKLFEDRIKTAIIFNIPVWNIDKTLPEIREWAVVEELKRAIKNNQGEYKRYTFDTLSRCFVNAFSLYNSASRQWSELADLKKEDIYCISSACADVTEQAWELVGFEKKVLRREVEERLENCQEELSRTSFDLLVKLIKQAVNAGVDVWDIEEQLLELEEAITVAEIEKKFVEVKETLTKKSLNWLVELIVQQLSAPDQKEIELLRKERTEIDSEGGIVPSVVVLVAKLATETESVFADIANQLPSLEAKIIFADLEKRVDKFEKILRSEEDAALVKDLVVINRDNIRVRGIESRYADEMVRVLTSKEDSFRKTQFVALEKTIIMHRQIIDSSALEGKILQLQKEFFPEGIELVKWLEKGGDQDDKTGRDRSEHTLWTETYGKMNEWIISYIDKNKPSTEEMGVKLKEKRDEETVSLEIMSKLTQVEKSLRRSSFSLLYRKVKDAKKAGINVSDIEKQLGVLNEKITLKEINKELDDINRSTVSRQLEVTTEELKGYEDHFRKVFLLGIQGQIEEAAKKIDVSSFQSRLWQLEEEFFTENKEMIKWTKENDEQLRVVLMFIALNSSSIFR